MASSSLPGFPSANWLIPGRLIHAGYPGASDDAAAAAIAAAVTDASVTAIVCLQPERELAPLPPYLGKFDPAHISPEGPLPLSWLHMPVRDGGIADDDRFCGLLEQCIALLAKGSVLLVHCLGGHGRSGVVCAVLASAVLGLSAGDALALVQARHNEREDPWARQHRSVSTQGLKPWTSCLLSTSRSC